MGFMKMEKIVHQKAYSSEIHWKFIGFLAIDLNKDRV